ncbi:MAG: DUF3150 domain-containing protein [Proteobacteria bacterium]|nr:DUF3150 domain-containing protein [Pseudomonadota bacterium]MBU1387887.1 DUF3150 domain-containing protein [Pseudomonadota bacterium]MBU1544333.1 DUF3150 domain-containing protein [Pseudomonadota bacterium]MBU2430070.1 DUF3150 domain-containing protein [Pseudomonadota bacterium]MBU2482662.1 DUF3150 domain-containing protein [Pseudomonadota bacterium]
MDTTTDAKVFKHLMVLNLDVSIWSARKKLSPSDFGGARLPPEELASLGSKKICNPEDLRVFGTLKSRAVNMLDRIGIRFLGGWGIPESCADEVIKELKSTHDEFMKAKQKFLANYDQSIEAWINHHPEWKSIIKNSVVDAGYVSSRMGFKWQLFQIVPPKGKFIHDGLKDEVSKLGNTLYGEVAKTAEDTWRKCYSGKDKVSHKAISPLRSIYEKLNGLSFVEPCAAPIASLLRTAFDHIPRKGFIEGADLLILQGVLALLRDPESLVDYGKSIIKGKTPEAILQGLIQNDSAICPIPADVIDLSEAVSISNLYQQQPIDSLGLW